MTIPDSTKLCNCGCGRTRTACREQRDAELRTFWELSTDVPFGYCWCGCGNETPLAAKTSTKDTAVKHQPVRYLTGHQRYRQDPEYIEEDRGFETPCWIWTRRLTPAGYGMPTVNGKSVLAHRLYYEREYGPIPEKHDLHHECEQRSCVRPSHLTPMLRAAHVQAGRAAKLNYETVYLMRKLYAEGNISYSKLAKRFGVSIECAWSAVTGRKWK